MVNRILAVSLALSLLTLCFGAPAETAVEETAAEAVQETAAEAVREAAEEATESVQEVAESAAEAVEEAAESAAEAAQEAAEAAADAVEEAAESAAEEAGSATEEAADAVEDAVEAAAEGPAGVEALDFSGYTLDELLIIRGMVDAQISLRGSDAYEDLSRGDKGDAVSALQTRLKELGYYTGKVSGKYDTETQKAMKQFEKTNNLKNDGSASSEDQVVLFSDSAVAKGGNPLDIAGAGPPEPTQAPEEDPYSEYGEYDYTDIFRYPESHMNEKVKIIGKVVQVLGSRNTGYEVRLATAGSDDIIYVYIRFDPGYNILENDRLTVYARLNGTETYKSVWGNMVTIPRAVADAIELR